MRRRTKRIDIADTDVHTWFERDRAHVALVDARTDQTLAEWWDEDVWGLVEDGFLAPGDWHASAYEYAVHLGLIEPRE